MMEGNKYNIGDEVELDQTFAVVYIPTSTCELTLHAKVFIDGEIHEVETTMDFSEVRYAIKEAEEYIPSNAIFRITEDGRAYLEDLERGEIEDAD